MNDAFVWYAIAVSALVTAALRFLPFMIWGNGKAVPKIISRLGGVLPPAIMGMLVVYCLKDTSLASVAGFLPALLACAVVVGLHLWKRNTLLSIIAGTLCYMVLVQLVF